MGVAPQGRREPPVLTLMSGQSPRPPRGRRAPAPKPFPGLQLAMKGLLFIDRIGLHVGVAEHQDAKAAGRLVRLMLAIPPAPRVVLSPA